ncbi:hypothetical protein PV08_01693 [Exophiala spinifera]|uniref:C2H2-type domain-containing protein n=1 Tax=Exophiala spinifera TaxID=91928 RepID=A0A0D2BQ93_9EURO|nr:uncharacterized protein PV08_01693 [Exophiala spinifera]KIW21113.1 hypothetical protein PV08_01693 [Exophiala spinifera]
MKIKCTYEDCFRHFDSHAAMITHKVKDIKHSYCKVCDLDFQDDMHLFIHQLGTPAHICCPVCALEFKSIAGRDRHVEQSHRTGQNLSCAGCNTRFQSAASLMQHIENGECEIIGSRDFQMQRAEKQLLKETWAKETDPYNLSSPMESRTAGSARSRSLMDNEAENAGGGVSLYQPGVHTSASSEQHFPPLGTNPPKSRASSKSQVTTSNLINFDERANDMARLRISQSRPQARPWDPHAEPAPAPRENTASIRDWLGSVNSRTNPPSDNHSEVASIYDRKAAESAVSENHVPPSQRGGPFAVPGGRQVITMPAHSIITNTSGIDLEKYWDSLRQEYMCPGDRCLRAFKDQLDFKNHLLSSAHVGGQVTCPSCLKKFASTTAWVAHCESASKKCDIRKSADFNNVLREITGGVLGTSGFLGDGTVKYVAPRIEDW